MITKKDIEEYVKEMYYGDEEFTILCETYEDYEIKHAEELNQYIMSDIDSLTRFLKRHDVEVTE